MPKKAQLQNIVEVKAALADKYIRLAAKRKSKPGRATLLRHAERFRSQAKYAAHEVDQLKYAGPQAAHALPGNLK